MTFSHNAAANMVTNKGTGSPKQQNNNINYRQGFNGYQRGNGTRGRGRGRGYDNYNNRPICQVCGKVGHSAMVCYHRFDKEFSPIQNRGNGNMNFNGNMNYPPNRGSGQSQPNVFMTAQQTATPETIADPSWYADSGASNHVTGSYENITNATEYGGKECVTIGNGDKLPITCIGSASLSNGKHVLHLDNVLCVPEIAKNLVSISKLAQDNNVFIEFHGDFCLC